MSTQSSTSSESTSSLSSTTRPSRTTRSSPQPLSQSFTTLHVVPSTGGMVPPVRTPTVEVLPATGVSSNQPTPTDSSRDTSHAASGPLQPTAAPRSESQSQPQSSGGLATEHPASTASVLSQLSVEEIIAALQSRGVMNIAAPSGVMNPSLPSTTPVTQQQSYQLAHLSLRPPPSA